MATQALFFENQEFSDYAELKKKIEFYEQTEKYYFRRVHTTKLSTVFQNKAENCNQKLIYYDIYYKCQCPKGWPNSDCKVLLTLRINRSKTALVVKSFIGNHNHDPIPLSTMKRNFKYVVPQVDTIIVNDLNTPQDHNVSRAEINMDLINLDDTPIVKPRHDAENTTNDTNLLDSSVEPIKEPVISLAQPHASLPQDVSATINYSLLDFSIADVPIDLNLDVIHSRSIDEMELNKEFEVLFTEIDFNISKSSSHARLQKINKLRNLCSLWNETNFNLESSSTKTIPFSTLEIVTSGNTELKITETSNEGDPIALTEENNLELPPCGSLELEKSSEPLTISINESNTCVRDTNNNDSFLPNKMTPVGPTISNVLGNKSSKISINEINLPKKLTKSQPRRKANGQMAKSQSDNKTKKKFEEFFKNNK